MYLKGASRRNIGWWANHLLKDKENDRVEVIGKRGLASDDVRGMMREMQQNGSLSKRCKNFMHIASFNPQAHEHPTPEQWERMLEIYEEQRGIPKGTPRFIVEHEKKGRIHRHVIWQRVDLATMKAFPDGHNPKVCERAAERIELELGFERTPKMKDREPGDDPPPRPPKAWEMYRDKKNGLDTRTITAELTGLFRGAENAADFVMGLEQHGYQFVEGNRAYCVLDPAGNVHSLARRIEGVKTKDLKAFMQDVELWHLPTIEQAKERFQERKIAGLEAECTTLRDELQYEEALQRAAIEKEERERQFVEPEKETRGGATPEPPPEKNISVLRANAEMEQNEAQEPDITELLKREVAEIDRLLYGSTPEDRSRDFEDLDKFLAAELYERQKKYPNHYQTHWQDQIPPGVAADIEKLAAADREREAAQHDPARDEMAWLDSVARAAIAKEDREREFVEPRAEKPQPEKETRAGGTNEQQPEQQPAPPPNLKGAAARVREALQRSDTPEAFALALDERKIILACATREDAHRSRAKASFARQFGNFAPEYNEGEIVAVTYTGQVYKLSERNTGMKPEDMAAFLEPLDRRALKGITETIEIQTRARHDRNELHWATTPKPERPQQHATGLTMQDAPATSPALHFQDAARQTAKPEAAPDIPADLRGTAAEIWTAYNSRRVDREWQRENADGTKETMRDRITLKGGRDPLKFGMALDERGLILARATKEEAEQSQKDADHWKQHGETRPVYREAEFVVINRQGDVYSLNRRTTGHSAKEVQAFLNKADWKALPGIEAARETMKARADERLTAARDRSAIWDAIRLKNATRKHGGRGNGRNVSASDLARPLGIASRLSGRAIGALGALGKLADGFSLDALTPKEKYEAAKRDDRNEREADKNADYAAYTAELHERWRRDQQRQAEEKQREPERGR